MILETVLAMLLLASGLGFGPSWDTAAWMQLSGTELVVESERPLEGLEKLITSSGHVVSAHMETRVHLCCICCHRLYGSSLHVCRVQCARVVTAVPSGYSSRKAPLR